MALGAVSVSKLSFDGGIAAPLLTFFRCLMFLLLPKDISRKIGVFVVGGLYLGSQSFFFHFSYNPFYFFLNPKDVFFFVLLLSERDIFSSVFTTRFYSFPVGLEVVVLRDSFG